MDLGSRKRKFHASDYPKKVTRQFWRKKINGSDSEASRGESSNGSSTFSNSNSKRFLPLSHLDCESASPS
ncbi:hypothetical protein AMTR_s00205p00027600 [Amborella trichopoda]|uniref:Uncharacterized protein n=1 Tax=Amborella trichopoda TaxID=13333 RepID=W1P7R3_AMBTC|nr:hypothetical protein AMTR_s00205p00027600 [Amborella trichopoda]